MQAPASTDQDSRREGLAWSHELDLAQLLAAIGGTQLGEPGDEAAAAEEAAAADAAAAAPPRDLTGVVADQLPPGPALAACLSGADPAGLSEWDLPGVASAFRRLAAWAQAGELAAVAEMASRTAARDDHVRVDADGRPDQVTPAAASTVGLELVMSHPAAMAWTSLGVTLRWRLAATLAALSAGTIDLYRARLIAEATSPLDDDTARAVESAVLPKAGGQTSGQLRVALRRAVIAADPDGAEQRRKEAQRHAKVSLYPDPRGTATLAATRLPGVHAAAGMARLTAIARAMKSAGMAGGLDYLRAVALIGLILGTLPLVPPPAGDPGPAGPTDPDPGEPGPPGARAGGSRRGRGPWPRRLRSGNPDSTDSGTPGDPGDGAGGPRRTTTRSRRPEDHHPDDRRPGEPAPSDDEPIDEGPPDPGPPADPGDAYEDEDDDDGPFAPGPPAGWPPIPGTAAQIPPFLGQPPGRPPPASHPPPSGRPPPRRQPDRPSRGLLDLVISWRALTGDPAGPATLSRIGPVTGIQARLLALTAAADPHARWQVIVTDPDGYATATETIRRRHRQDRGDRPAGVTGQVTVTIPAAVLDQLARAEPGGPASDTSTTGSGIWAAVLRAARRAHARARRQAAADAAAPGGCAHTTATPAYRPTTKIRDHVTARDQTCRHPRCRQPARHTDLDHTTPYHQGGQTCGCNLGGHCRTHHKIKQLPGWTLTQPRPGHFQLTTPAGRTYLTTPDPYPT